MTEERVQDLIRAARRAARKMKAEYDRTVVADGHEPPPADECWAECEGLWDALEAFDFPF